MEFICQYCGWQFARKSDLIKHEKACVNRNDKERLLKLRRNWSDEQKQQYIKEGHCCKSCGVLLTEFYSSGEYCSRACSNRRNQTDEIKQKISEGVYKHNLEKGIIPINVRPKSYCKQCGIEISRKSITGHCVQCYRKTDEWHNKMVIAGQRAAATQQKRSKNEIAFCELCKQHFQTVIHNQPIFNGWDADIIIEDYKIAILWNGPWHYKKVFKERSLIQEQNRDRIKIEQIIECGYIPYVIKDLLRHDKDKVEREFAIFMNWIEWYKDEETVYAYY